MTYKLAAFVLMLSELLRPPNAIVPEVLSYYCPCAYLKIAYCRYLGKVGTVGKLRVWRCKGACSGRPDFCQGCGASRLGVVRARLPVGGPEELPVTSTCGFRLTASRSLTHSKRRPPGTPAPTWRKMTMTSTGVAPDRRKWKGVTWHPQMQTECQK